MATLQASPRASQATPVSSPPPHLRCSACDLPVFNGFQTPHGCRLCNSCVEKLPSGQKVPCPGKSDACRDPDEEIHINKDSCSPDIASRREIGRIQVFCPNKHDGCDWQAKWKDVDTHLEACKFQKVTCDKCQELVLQKKMDSHLKNECPKRQVKCDLCSQQVVFSDLGKIHKNIESPVCCPKFKSQCPHCSDKSRKMDRVAFVQHLSQCPEKPQECKFKHLGCEVRAKESELQKHYRDDAYLHVEMIDKKLKDQARNQGMTAHHAPQHAGNAVISTTQQKEMEKKFTTMYEMFKKLQVNVANWAHVSIELDDTMSKFGGVSQMKSFLKNLEDKIQHGGVSEGSSRGGGSVDASTIELLQKVDALEKRISWLEETSFDGNFTWKISEWSIKQSEREIKSPAFFSHRFGYKFRLKLFPSGINGGNHVSVQLLVESGEYDDALDWPLKCEISIAFACISNRSEDCKMKEKVECQKPLGSEFNPCTTWEKSVNRRQMESFVKSDNCYVTAIVALVTSNDNSKRRKQFGTR